MHVLIVVVSLAYVPTPSACSFASVSGSKGADMIAPYTLHPDISLVSLLYLVAPLAAPHFRYALVPCTIW